MFRIKARIEQEWKWTVRSDLLIPVYFGMQRTQRLKMMRFEDTQFNSTCYEPLNEYTVTYK